MVLHKLVSRIQAVHHSVLDPTAAPEKGMAVAVVDKIAGRYSCLRDTVPQLTGCCRTAEMEVDEEARHDPVHSIFDIRVLQLYSARKGLDSGECRLDDPHLCPAKRVALRYRSPAAMASFQKEDLVRNSILEHQAYVSPYTVSTFSPHACCAAPEPAAVHLRVTSYYAHAR